MAAAALGCGSRKELYARFRKANPATECDLERLHKWMQGRSLPRAASVYTDFAAVIGTAKPGHWIADSSLEDFAAELALRTGADIATLAVPGGVPARSSRRTAGLFGGIATLAGSFAAYSAAWSPHYHGRLIRGALRLEAHRSGALIAAYAEAVAGRAVRLTAEMQIGGRSMHCTLREADGDMVLFLSLQVPGPPASMLCGIMAGAAFVAHESLPSACPVAFIRVPETPRLEAGNRYIEPVPGTIAADLADLGVTPAEADRFDAMIRAFLGSSPIQVAPQDQAGFASMLDREYLAGTD
ncbi:MAG TPA: hypothetical protein VGM87_09085 [Roseomonas sp.]